MKILFFSIFTLFCFAIDAQQIVINEILAANKNTIKDAAGDNDDYAEFYNPSGHVRDVSNYYISDDKDTLNKCKLPAGTQIKPYSYLLVWFDGETNEKGIHCNFKLNAKGDRLILSKPNMELVDKKKFKRQYKDISYGRYGDGGKDWIYMKPSPNAKNTKTRILAKSTKKKVDQISVKTDGAKSKFIVSASPELKLNYRIMDKEDKTYLKGQIADGKGEINITSLPNGKYRLYLGKNEYRIIKYH